eukprot:354548-Chlamydomonas_euryale.AAC.19
MFGYHCGEKCKAAKSTGTAHDHVPCHSSGVVPFPQLSRDIPRDMSRVRCGTPRVILFDRAGDSPRPVSVRPCSSAYYYVVRLLSCAGKGLATSWSVRVPEATGKMHCRHSDVSVETWRWTCAVCAVGHRHWTH